jgi:hypothetical protein
MRHVRNIRDDADSSAEPRLSGVVARRAKSDNAAESSAAVLAEVAAAAQEF